MDPMQMPNFPVIPSPAVQAVRATDRQTAVLTHLLDGAATFKALILAVKELSRLAPDDHDVLVVVGEVRVGKVRYLEPHTLAFEGRDQNGQRAWVVQHFSQMSARVVHVPKRGPSRVITGFAPTPS